MLAGKTHGIPYNTEVSLSQTGCAPWTKNLNNMLRDNSPSLLLCLYRTKYMTVILHERYIKMAPKDQNTD